MNGPSKRTLAGYHLTEAIRHLSAATFLVGATDCVDSDALALNVSRAEEITRDARAEVEGRRRVASTSKAKEISGAGSD